MAVARPIPEAPPVIKIVLPRGGFAVRSLKLYGSEAIFAVRSSRVLDYAESSSVFFLKSLEGLPTTHKHDQENAQEELR